MASDALRSYFRTLRVGQGLTRRQLAERSNVRMGLIAAWELGEVGTLKDTALIRIAIALGASLEDMAELEEGLQLGVEAGAAMAMRRLAALPYSKRA